jgi:hypothetical protein
MGFEWLKKTSFRKLASLMAGLAMPPPSSIIRIRVYLRAG